MGKKKGYNNEADQDDFHGDISGESFIDKKKKANRKSADFMEMIKPKQMIRIDDYLYDVFDISNVKKLDDYEYRELDGGQVFFIVVNNDRIRFSGEETRDEAFEEVINQLRGFGVEINEVIK